MYLVIGDSHDEFCRRVHAVMEARGLPVRANSNPLHHPSVFSWRLGSHSSVSQLAWGGVAALPDEHILGVFVRHCAGIDPVGWQSNDLAYVYAETQAALLAWLWSLPCPVINRSPAALWYCPNAPVVSWLSQLRRCGLPALKVLVTNIEEEALEFRRALEREGVRGAVYMPLTDPHQFLVLRDEDWRGLAAMQRVAPIALAEPHGRVHLACVVGEQVIWERAPPPELVQYEAALRRFARKIGLAFVELAFAYTRDEYSVIAVQQHPCSEHFGEETQQHIARAIVDLLASRSDTAHSCAAHTHVREVS